MLFAADRSGILWLFATLVVWFVGAQVVQALNYKSRAEIPTQENVVKRIAEHQGAQRFGRWKVVNALISAVFWTVLVFVAAMYLLSHR
jgi:hypothetical protein